MGNTSGSTASTPQPRLPPQSRVSVWRERVSLLHAEARSPTSRFSTLPRDIIRYVVEPYLVGALPRLGAVPPATSPLSVIRTFEHSGVLIQGLCIDHQSHVVFSDWHANRVTVMRAGAGTLLRHFGVAGAGGVKLWPRGIACDQDGVMYVSDALNHRICVFQPGGAYWFSIGAEGQQPGEFYKPTALAIDTQGRLVVADTDNGRVQVFSLKGQLLAVVSTVGAVAPPTSNAADSSHDEPSLPGSPEAAPLPARVAATAWLRRSFSSTHVFELNAGSRTSLTSSSPAASESDLPDTTTTTAAAGPPPPPRCKLVRMHPPRGVAIDRRNNNMVLLLSRDACEPPVVASVHTLEPGPNASWVRGFHPEAPPLGYFVGIAVDALGRIVLLDTEGRLQVHDEMGTLLYSVKSTGARATALCIDAEGAVYVAAGSRISVLHDARGEVVNK